jgi:hypothetical protein
VTQETWSWLALAGLGAFHGLNPAMGWLFAVALGLHRQSRAAVYLSLVPIGFGHALSVGTAGAAFVLAGFVANVRALGIGAGLLLVGWAAYHWRWGHRQRVRVGLQAGLAGLTLWSFLMASAHGAGLMLWPVLMPLCFPTQTVNAGIGPVGLALTGLAVHTAAVLAVTAATAGIVYEWLGLAALRHAWVNLDMLWRAALLTTGAMLVMSGAAAAEAPILGLLAGVAK